MTPTSLPQIRYQPLKMLRAVALGLAICCAAPAIAEDNLPEVQRLIKQAQYPQALEKIDAYLSNKPKDAQGRFIKGLIYTEMNKSAEAIAIFTKLTEDYPELPEPYNNLAVLYAQQKQYDKSRTALEMAIRTHPSYAIAYENLGDVYAKLASQAYDKALQLDTSNASTQSKLALIRDLITTSSRGSKPAPAAVPSAPVIAPQPPAAPPAVQTKPAVAPTANVITTTPGAAAISQIKPIETKPLESKPATSPLRADGEEDIAKAIANWANAWSRKDMRAYLGAYASDFTAPNGVGRKAWEKEREQRIAHKAGKISVTFDSPQISINGDKASARFRQHYEAPGLSTSAYKTLVFVRSANKWLIKEENSR